MRSYILLLLCMSGCDLIFVLDPPPENVCGRFGKPVPLTFDSTLTDPKYFSRRKTAKAGDPEYGVVHATRNGTAKVYVVQREPNTDTWSLSAAPRNNMLMGTLGASMGELDFEKKTDQLYVWQSTPTTVYQSEFTLQGYSLVGAAALLAEPDYDITIGNVVEVLEVDPATMMMRAQRKRGVFTKTPRMGGKNILVFADLIVPYTSREWVTDSSRTQPLNAEPGLELGRGVLTDDTFTLVYAAKFNGGSSDLYASRRDQATKDWGRGDLIVDLNTDDMDETDPWINSDCSEIYFTRGGVTYRAARPPQ